MQCVPVLRLLNCRLASPLIDRQQLADHFQSEYRPSAVDYPFATTLHSKNMEETQTRHKKELKALDGEKRAAIKKAKALKGKKGKEALAG